MPASVQPESNIDVDVDIQATDDLDPVIGEVAEVERPNDQDADEAAQVAKMPPVGDAELEAARFRRFCVLAEKLVPNKDIWSKVYHPPADVFAPEELPFEEKKNWCWKFWDSLMFPCIASTIAMLASMFTLYSYIVSLQLSRVVSAPDVRSNWGVKVLTAGPLVFAIGALPVLSEHPARLLLYYRLWERKVVINFKERDITDPATMRQMGLIGIIIAGYALYGWRSEYVSDKWSYTFIVLQSLGAMGLTIYQTLPVESWLQGVNEAFRHYQNNDTEKHGERSYRYQDKVVKAFEQVQFVPERCVKYDIKAIQAYAEVLEKTYRKAKSKHKSAPSAVTTTAIAVCQEEEQWLKVLALWIGRLDNTKEIVQTRVVILRTLRGRFFPYRNLSLRTILERSFPPDAFSSTTTLTNPWCEGGLLHTCEHHR